MATACAVLVALSATATAPPAAAAAPDQRSTASSSAVGASPADLSDAPAGSGGTGRQWSAAPGDDAPWAQVSWPAAHRVASVQLSGPQQVAFDPGQSTAAALHGTLRFSDGSSVVVSGIAGGGDLPTTVAFAPRTATWVRLDLRRTVPNAVLGLREMAVFDAGTTPPRWPSPTAGYTGVPVTASCTSPSPSVAAPAADHLTLACPTPGTAVGGLATVIVNAAPGTAVVARTWRPALDPAAGWGAVRRVATARADGSGRATLTVDTRDLPQGPIALRVTRTDPRPTAGEQPLHVQLLNTTGVPSGTRQRAPAGMTLQWDEEFDAPLSVSTTGTSTTYAAVKPEPWGGSQFGGAVFADPSSGAGTLATVGGGYLRLRAEPIADHPVVTSWDQQHVAGILSSQHVGGSGFSAQYGYFEARLLGAPGPGAWPAFWMLDSESGTGRADGTAGELDAVELYGHDTAGTCHTTHAWGQDPDGGGQLVCLHAVRPADWAVAWHTYGARVEPGAATFFIDGVQVAHLSGLSHTDEPFFFMLDMALGGGWPVDLSRTGGICDLYTDWVRVYT